MIITLSRGVRSATAAIHGGVSLIPALAAVAVASIAFEWQRNPGPSPSNNLLYAIAVVLCFAAFISAVGWLVTWNVVAHSMRSRAQLVWGFAFAAGWLAFVAVLVFAPQGFSDWYLD